MNCEFICHRIQEAIIKYQKENNNPDLTDHLVVIDIRQSYESNPLVLNLELKN